MLSEPASSLGPLVPPPPPLPSQSTVDGTSISARPGSITASISSSSARRRISRACDQCNQFRTRCDGKLPCKRCSDLVIQCEYARQMKKRGKGSHRYASISSAKRQEERVTASASPVNQTHTGIPLESQRILASESPVLSAQLHIHQSIQQAPQQIRTHSQSQVQSESQSQHGTTHSHVSHVSPVSSMGSIDSSSVSGPIEDRFNQTTSEYMRQIQGKDRYMDGLDDFIAPEIAHIFNGNGLSKTGTSGTTASIFVQTPGTTTPRWLNIRSPFPASLSALFATPISGSPRPPADDSQSVYPVLAPILPSLDFISPSLAADLLEVYFTNTIYGIGHFTRKSSILAIDRPPRQCSPALLYSFLYIAAHVSDHPHMTATPTSRNEIIARLFELTISHLRPLIHSHHTGTLDDVMTYIHLGIISSASEFKGSSLRWWHAAWGLARVLKLNVETASTSVKSASTISEELKEEKRRVWWLLFLVDRHLGLCYNRPISVLEHESSTLFRPCRDDIWQSDAEILPAELDSSRERGLTYRVTGRDVWGYFLPLMTLLGGIVDLHQLETNNTLACTREVLEPIRVRLRQRLDDFIKSVDDYERITPEDNESSGSSPGTSTPTQRMAQRTCWKEYCRCLIHVFHILVSGYWDPIDMLSLPHTMVLDQDFVSVIQHSLDFAKCTKRILDLDQDLRIIPFFFGIHMLQGSFTLLYIVDVLGDKEVRVACETIVRAHEVCIVTLNTEYQRNFRQIIRGALQMIDALEERKRYAAHSNRSMYGASPTEESIIAEIEDSKRRRRGLLSLYRWCRGGNGLAV
ncbi:fungal-specific transcription factor domain-containing protein [Lipomyces arxii]|uniref:fungal-specific transcription factor domain-containing protein n=1 Tax=Lipomyces arxii TaxID=56418 RepID=UPI0034CFCD68